jgi:hypothetical protein
MTDDNHRLLALWAADCAEHVLNIFEGVRPNDDRPRQAIEAVRAWVSGEINMMRARELAGAARAVAGRFTGSP